MLQQTLYVVSTTVLCINKAYTVPCSINILLPCPCTDKMFGTEYCKLFCMKVNCLSYQFDADWCNCYSCYNSSENPLFQQSGIATKLLYIVRLQDMTFIYNIHSKIQKWSRCVLYTVRKKRAAWMVLVSYKNKLMTVLFNYGSCDNCV